MLVIVSKENKEKHKEKCHKRWEGGTRNTLLYGTCTTHEEVDILIINVYCKLYSNRLKN